MAEPPSYSARDHHARSRQSAGSSNLGAGVLGATYTISLENSKAHKWLSMRVLSRSSNPTSPPYFYQGDKITGHVDLDVLKSEAIKAITIKVTGSTTFVGQEENEFLMIEKELWSPSIPLSDGSKVLKFEKGKFSWPFSISLPSDVELHDGKTKRTFPLPSTFSERASAGYLDYKLTVTVRRGGLKFNQTLAASFAYVPVTRPQPPSLMLQKAFKENFPIVGPRGDPTGWHVLPTVTIKGTLFASRQVEISCILALANPLTYARGSAAPVWLTMLGTDIQALDLLSAPSAVQLFLVRSLATGLDATTDMDSAERRTDNFFVETVSKGVFWPAKNSSKSMIEKEVSRKVLQGEVEVKRSLKPSCLFPKFTTRVSASSLLPCCGCRSKPCHLAGGISSK
ncbi:hypothetical protein ID866_7810 [Astraeus odoratus]|nr:hypothetical protein ID866_7810 [Astraeus odoratus]